MCYTDPVNETAALAERTSAVTGPELLAVIPGRTNVTRVAHMLDVPRTGSGNRQRFTLGEAIACHAAWHLGRGRLDIMAAIVEAVDHQGVLTGYLALGVRPGQLPAMVAADLALEAVAPLAPDAGVSMIHLLDVDAAIADMEVIIGRPLLVAFPHERT